MAINKNIFCIYTYAPSIIFQWSLTIIRIPKILLLNLYFPQLLVNLIVILWICLWNYSLNVVLNKDKKYQFMICIKLFKNMVKIRMINPHGSSVGGVWLCGEPLPPNVNKSMSKSTFVVPQRCFRIMSYLLWNYWL